MFVNCVRYTLGERLTNYIFVIEFEAEYWEQDEDSEEPFEEPSADPTEATPPSPEDKEVSAVVWWIVAFISLFQSLHVISDRAIAWLIKFISILLNYCGHFSLKLKNVARALPRSLYLRNKRLFDFDSVDFYKYVVCPSCHCLYHFQDLYEKRYAKHCEDMSYSIVRV